VVTSILTGPRKRQDGVEPPLRQTVDVLQQVMCKRYAEKLAVSVLEICEDRYAAVSLPMLSPFSILRISQVRTDAIIFYSLSY